MRRVMPVTLALAMLAPNVLADARALQDSELDQVVAGADFMELYSRSFNFNDKNWFDFKGGKSGPTVVVVREGNKVVFRRTFYGDTGSVSLNNGRLSVNGKLVTQRVFKSDASLRIRKRGIHVSTN